MTTPTINYDAMLDEQLASPDYHSRWNQTTLRTIAVMAAGYCPIDNPGLLPAATRAKALRVLDGYLTASHYYNMLPRLFLTSYGREFQLLRRVAYRVLDFSRRNPDFAIPQPTLAAWLAAAGLPSGQ